MKIKMLFLLLGVLILTISRPAAQNAKPASDPDAFVNVNAAGVIIDGYDPVAFFTEGEPVKGSRDIRSAYKGAIYQFASADHKKLFDDNPEKYKVQYGGWCAYAVSRGRTASVDIDTWSIINGRLIFQYSKRIAKEWNKDPQGNLKKADKYWPYVAGAKGKQISVDE